MTNYVEHPCFGTFWGFDTEITAAVGAEMCAVGDCEPENRFGFVDVRICTTSSLGLNGAMGICPRRPTFLTFLQSLKTTTFTTQDTCWHRGQQ